jgi:hypothetical protein
LVTLTKSLLSLKVFVAITAVAIVMLFLSLSFNPARIVIIERDYPWFRLFTQMHAVGTLVSLYGYWIMRRWGVALYGVNAALSMLYLQAISFGGLTLSYILILLVFSVGLIHWRRMT